MAHGSSARRTPTSPMRTSRKSEGRIPKAERNPNSETRIRGETFHVSRFTFHVSRITHHASRSIKAFTMIEIAICLAVIGFALAAIIGVLPLGMNVQRENREGTVINQDATIFLEAISKGARGMDDLTNYVFAVTNNWVLFNANGSVKNSGINGYTFSKFSTAAGTPYDPGLP